MLHSLRKIIEKKANLERFLKGLEMDEKLEIAIPQEQFEQEVHDFQQHTIADFLGSSLFKREFVVENRKIKTLGTV